MIGPIDASLPEGVGTEGKPGLKTAIICLERKGPPFIIMVVISILPLRYPLLPLGAPLIFWLSHDGGIMTTLLKKI